MGATSDVLYRITRASSGTPFRLSIQVYRYEVRED